jgi:hypothetical protein
MADPDLSKKSLPDLIVALLCGHAARLAHSPSSEPARVAAILAELRRRTGQDFGADPHVWRDWFLSTYPLDQLQLQFAETRRRIQEIERRALRKSRR